MIQVLFSRCLNLRLDWGWDTLFSPLVMPLSTYFFTFCSLILSAIICSSWEIRDSHFYLSTRFLYFYKFLYIGDLDVISLPSSNLSWHSLIILWNLSPDKEKYNEKSWWIRFRADEPFRFNRNTVSLTVWLIFLTAYEILAISWDKRVSSSL